MVKVANQIPEPFYYALITSYSYENKKIFISARENNFKKFDVAFAYGWQNKLKIHKALKSLKKHISRVIELPFKFMREIIFLVTCILRIIFNSILNFHKLFRSNEFNRLQRNSNFK